MDDGRADFDDALRQVSERTRNFHIWIEQLILNLPTDWAFTCAEFYKDELPDWAKRVAGSLQDVVLDYIALDRMPYDEYLASEHWKLVSDEAKERDGHRCRICNSDGTLHVHHRTYERRGRERPEDVITLCAECHRLFHDVE